MTKSIQQNPNHHYWFIHRYCFERRPLLTAGHRDSRTWIIGNLAGGVLARAALQFGVTLYAYAFLSKRMFLIVGAPGHELPGFNRFLFSSLSKRVTPKCKPVWQGPLWERHAKIVAIDPAHLGDHVAAARLVQPERHTVLHFDREAKKRLPCPYPWFTGRVGDFKNAHLLRLRVAPPPGEKEVVLYETNEFDARL
jgi:hypothetical protein